MAAQEVLSQLVLAHAPAESAFVDHIDKSYAVISSSLLHAIEGSFILVAAVLSLFCALYGFARWLSTRPSSMVCLRLMPA